MDENKLNNGNGSNDVEKQESSDSMKKKDGISFLIDCVSLLCLFTFVIGLLLQSLPSLLGNTAIINNMNSSFYFEEKESAAVLFDMTYTQYETNEGPCLYIEATPVDEEYEKYAFTKTVTKNESHLFDTTQNGMWITIHSYCVTFNDGSKTFESYFDVYEGIDDVIVDNSFAVGLRDLIIQKYEESDCMDLDKLNAIAQEYCPLITFRQYKFVIPTTTNVTTPAIDDSELSRDEMLNAVAE